MIIFGYEMNKNQIFGVIGVLVVVVVGYMLLARQNKPAQQPAVTTTTQETASPATPSEVTVTLSEQSSSDESGVATLAQVDGKVKVTLSLTGAGEDVVQPAHIHVGTCPDVGAVKYPLTSPVNGKSEITLDVTLAQLRSELPLAINVHKSVAEASVYVSCGDLVL